MLQQTKTIAGSKSVLTINEVARRLRCSKAHVCNLMNGRVQDVPRLPHATLGRRKLTTDEWLATWMEATKNQ